MVSFDELDEGGTQLSAAPPSALDLVETRDLQRTVAAAVAGLPEEQREVIILKEYQGLTFLEIAEILDVPTSTVKTRLYRGLGHLRERLVREGFGGRAVIPAPTP